MKTKRRLYVPGAGFSAGIELTLNENQSHYLLSVLRLTAGAEVHVFNETGEWEARIQKTENRKQNIALSLIAQTHPPLAAPVSRLTLTFSPLKKDRTDFLVEKASELGVHVLQPVLCQHTQSDRVNTTRLQATAIEAAEQCDRLDAPTVLQPMKLTDYLQSLSPDSVLFFAAERGDAVPVGSGFSSSTPSAANLHFLIGPEGGFSDEEFQKFNKYPQIQPIRLGPRLLRAETAAVAVLSAYQAIAGDWAAANSP